MPAAFVPLTALLTSAAILLMGSGLQGTLLPIRAQIEAFSPLDIGLLGSAYYLGFICGAYLGPHIVSRVGHIRTFTAMVAIASAVALAHALILNPIVWLPLRAITGLCFAVLYMVIESWLGERANNQNRGAIFSVYTIISLTVITVGQSMITLDDPGNFPLFAISSILVSLAAVPIALARSPEPKPITAVRLRGLHLLRTSPVGFGGAFAHGLAIGAFWAFGPVFAQANLGGTTNIALFMSAAVIGGAIGQWPVGRFSDRVDRRKVIAFVAIFAASTGFAMTVLAHSPGPGLIISAFLFGMAAFPLYSLSVAHMNDSVDQGGFVEAAGGLLFVFGAGAIVGPFLAAIVIRGGGLDLLFAFTAVVHVSAALFALQRITTRERPKAADREPFVDSLNAARTVSTIDLLPAEPSTDAE